MEFSDIQLANHLNVNRSTAFRWRKAGCPTSDLEAASAWAQNRKPAHKDTPEEVASPIAAEPTESAAEAQTAYNVRDRLQSQEKTISLEITGLNAALQEARSSNDEKLAFKLLQSLKSAREEHRKQADSLLKCEARIIGIERSRGLLISLEAARGFVTSIITPLTIFLRKLPDAGRSEEEKGLLGTLGEAGLAILRDSAAAAVGFNGR